MSRFVAYEKLSKRQKKEIDKARRATWGLVNPVSRRVESAKTYNRKRRRREEWDSSAGVLICI